MAFDKAPIAWLDEGYGHNVDGSNHFIAITTADDEALTPLLTRLSDADADETTGDVRKLFFALHWMMWQAWLAVAVADRPRNMLLGHTQSLTEPDGGGNLQVRHVFTSQFVTEADALTNEEVADEPS